MFLHETQPDAAEGLALKEYGPTRSRLLSGDLPLEFPGLGIARRVAQSRAIQGLRPIEKSIASDCKLWGVQLKAKGVWKIRRL